MSKVKDIYTTGAVAKMLQVSPATINKWFDAGKFEGGYRIPMSLDRRITRRSLIKFMEVNKFPKECLKIYGLYRVLVVGSKEAYDKISSQPYVNNNEYFEVKNVSSLYEGGFLLCQFMPTCIIINTDIGRIESSLVMDYSRSVDPSTRIIGIVHGSHTAPEFGKTIRHPFTADELIKAVIED